MKLNIENDRNGNETHDGPVFPGAEERQFGGWRVLTLD